MMKSSTRLLWRIALVLFVTGMFCLGGAYVFGGFDIRNFSTDNVERITFTCPVADKIGNIVVDDSNTSVKVLTGGSGEISVSYANSDTHIYSITYTDPLLPDGSQELHIKGEKNPESTWMDYIAVMQIADMTLYITVPSDYDLMSNLSITTSNGKVLVDGVSAAQQLDIKTSNSSVTVMNLSTPKLSMTSSNGSMSISDVSVSGTITGKTSNASLTLENVSAENISMTSSSGRAKISSVTATGDLIVKTSNASLTFENVTAGSISATSSSGSGKLFSVNADTVSLKTSNGSVTADAVKASSVNITTSNGSLSLSGVKSAEEITANTTNSSISLNAIDAQNITLTTSNGKVSGSIYGNKSDYRITSRTSGDSKNNLGDDTGDVPSASMTRTLNVKTSNASININFAG